MPVLVVHGVTVSLPDQPYYEHLIGIAYSTCSVAGVMATLVSEQNTLSAQTGYLEQNIPLIPDAMVRDSFSQFQTQFSQAIDLDRNITLRLAFLVGSDAPHNSGQAKRLVGKLDELAGTGGLPALFRMTPELADLYDRLLATLGLMSDTKLAIVDRILQIHPTLRSSEYIDRRDLPRLSASR